jgi:translation elongation factor EF-1beta
MDSTASRSPHDANPPISLPANKTHPAAKMSTVTSVARLQHILRLRGQPTPAAGFFHPCASCKSCAWTSLAPSSLAMPMLCLRVLKHVLSDHFDVCLLHVTQVPHLLPVHQRVPLLAGTTQACPSSQEANSEELAAVVAQLEQKVASLDMVVEEQCDGIKKLNAEVSITDCLSESVCSVAFSHGLLMDSW